MWGHLMMLHTLIALELNIFQNKIEKSIANKNATNIYRMQAYSSVMCEYFCIGFIDFMLKGKNLLDYTIYFFIMNMKRMTK